MEKVHVDRRVAQMEAEGVTFHYGAHVGVNVPADKLLRDYDAVVLTGGAEAPRDLPVPGRDLKGIHFAMDFLRSRTAASPAKRPTAARDPRHRQACRRHRRRRYRVGLHCTSFRQGALSVTNFEIMPKPPLHENKALTCRTGRSSCAPRRAMKKASTATSR